MDAKIVEQLKAAHPDEELHMLSGGGVELVVKAPGRSEWQRFKVAQADDRKKINAAETLLKSCTVYPDMSTIDQMIVKRPGLADRFALELIELAGMTLEVEKKRL